jgi:MerR family transcriptional regulator, light-induced transcriptional regulator
MYLIGGSSTKLQVLTIMNAFTIKDLDNLSGIKAHTIRIWEQRYSFLKPQRTDTNIRYYSNEQLKTVLNIALLNKYGYKISHIDKMPPEDLMRKILDLSEPEARQERVLNELVNHMIDLEMDALEETLDEFIFYKGIDKTINQLIFPFLEKIGILWQTSHINPAQEHLVTNIIRQKILVGIESVNTRVASNATVLLFLPENEFHELGLLYIYFLLKTRGIKVLYLGANVPLKDLSYIIELKSPTYIQTHLTSVARNFNLEKFLNGIHQKFPSLKLIVSGPVTHGYKKSIPPNVSFKKSLKDVIDHIELVD